MARLLAIEWDAREIRVAVARLRGKDADYEQAFAIELQSRDAGSGEAAATDADIGKILAKELAARNLARTDTLVAVGRTSIELRVLTIPPAPPEDLPDMVRFQALKQFSTLGDDWSLDFVPLDHSTDGAINVLAAAISPDMVKQLHQSCEAAHLAVRHLVLRPFAAASLWRRRDTSPRCSLMVDLLTDEVDLSVLVDNQVVFLRTVRLASSAGGEEQVRAMLGEIRRTIAAAQNQLTGQRVERIILCDDGSDHALLKSQLENQLSLDVELFDPFSALSLVDDLRTRRPDHPGRFAPLLGMLADEAAGAAHAIDFLHPRKRPTPVNFRRRNSLIAATAAAVVLGVTGLIWMQYNELAVRAAELSRDVLAAENTLKQKRPMQDEVEKIDAFIVSDVTWLDELYWLSDRFLPAEQSIVAEMSWRTLPQLGAQIHLDCYALEAGLVDQLERQLRDERHGVDVSSIHEDQKQETYRWKFKSDVGVAADEPDARLAPRDAESPGKKPTPTQPPAAATPSQPSGRNAK